MNPESTPTQEPLQNTGKPRADRAEHAPGLPSARGLYDPRNEHDSCGVGFIAHLKGKRSHAIVQDALTMLQRMDHRGGCGCETNTGDGAGLLTALPHKFLRAAAQRDAGIDLPEPGRYAAGNLFLPQESAPRNLCKDTVARELARAGLKLLGWRKLPIDPDGADVGPTARSTMPIIEQLFVAADPSMDDDAFERTLYLVRNRVINLIQCGDNGVAPGAFYLCSLSARTITYKGQLTPAQVPAFYPDLRSAEYTSHLAMVHSRFSTNTFPSWDRAQPFRMMSHNGEINTVQGNKNWVAARQGLMRSGYFGDDLQDLFPIVNREASDSGSFDNVLEMLVMNGRSLPEAIMMMIPEAWENHASMGKAKRDFYAYHAHLMEPWDGPASVSFTDGRVIGACLDRNGLRPSRYYLTADDRVIMASEVGVVDVDPAIVRAKGRLEPGRMFLVDFDEGRVIPDDEVKARYTGARPYGEWLAEHPMSIDDLPSPRGGERRAADHGSHDAPGGAGVLPAFIDEPTEAFDGPLLARLMAFGYTIEHLHVLMLPMVKNGKEALGSMGNDSALAVLSDKPRLLFDYFKQLFAQVTNPPIDPIREQCIMALDTMLGPEGNLLETTPQQCDRIKLPHPILTDDQLGALKALEQSPVRGWRSRTIDTTYPRAEEAGGAAIRQSLERISAEVDRAIEDGCKVVVLSDRAAGPFNVPLPSLVAVGAVHHHLIRTQSRTRIGLVLESGEPREVHHFCTLLGYGVDAVNPYLAFEALFALRDQGVVDKNKHLPDDKLVDNFIKAINLGILKVMSKMGISTVASYRGAQIFEALGLGEDIIDRCFAGTASRLQGCTFDTLADECNRRHNLAYPRRDTTQAGQGKPQLPNPGEYHWRAGGEPHAYSPPAIASLQVAARTNSSGAYDQFAKHANDDAQNRSTLRGLLRLKTLCGAEEIPGESGPVAQRPSGQVENTRPLDHSATGPLPLSQVEPAADIVKRFRTGAMSLGALSEEAHETLALAMNRIGGRSNSGEGGEDPKRFALEQYADGTPMSKRSAIKQIASGRFGVTSYYLANADMLQIKIAQGAKPGEGGQLPGYKVNETIAKLRYATPGVGLISPPPHHDIYSIEDLSQLIFDLKNANPAADVSVKLVSEVGVGTIAAGVAKAHADHILISGHDGGTGASPLTSVKHAGLPWELGLAETHQTLVMNDLRSRVRLETDGGMKTGRDVVIAALLGAEEFGFSTAPLVATGCIMMRKCHLNTCPVGVCTQDPVLRKKFTGQPEHVINYLFLVAEEARRYMARLGVRTIDELIGRVDLLDARDAIQHWKADGLNLAPILTAAKPPAHRDNVGTRKLIAQAHALDEQLDRRLIEHCEPALEARQRVEYAGPITNTDRTVGTMLSHAISTRLGEQGLPDDCVALNFRGSAGQSLGAFLAPGVTLTVTGDANDYAGKGLSGGKLIVRPPATSTFAAERQVIVGNVALYGATRGEAYFRGIAAERFAVRNSGAHAVVEGVGDHGCEYMTGGRVVVLGPTGRNFAAGMSGGIAYVWDRDEEFESHCNTEMVELEKLGHGNDVMELLNLLQRHMILTQSPVAEHVIENWARLQNQFIKVMPIDYRRVLNQRKQQLAPTPEVGHA
ncbi:glutamate synthase large subunit [Phycisphaeraceae bacterium D3-23]